jgi:hypothetical protein
MAHFLSDVSHGQLFRGGQVAKEKKLSKRNVIAIELPRQVEQKLTLAEQNEIRQLSVVFTLW